MDEKKPFLHRGHSRHTLGLSAWGPRSRLCRGSHRFVGYPGNYLSFLGVRNEEVSASGRDTVPGRGVLQGCHPVLGVLPPPPA